MEKYGITALEILNNQESETRDNRWLVYQNVLSREKNWWLRAQCTGETRIWMSKLVKINSSFWFFCSILLLEFGGIFVFSEPKTAQSKNVAAVELGCTIVNCLVMEKYEEESTDEPVLQTFWHYSTNKDKGRKISWTFLNRPILLTKLSWSRPW